ncbi:MAG: redoxin domain-containing protein [Saprospiraceae bacterium]
MKYLIAICTMLFLWPAMSVTGQLKMHDFTATDVHGQTHQLYSDYLDKKKIVVIKFFFTSCPPCIANAPLWQAKYEQLGSGSQGIEFFSVTTLSSDDDTAVKSFEATYHQTMKAVSTPGNAPGILNPFRDGTYGSWWGTPSFAVISPDKTLQYPVFFSQLDDAINTAKTQVGGGGPIPSTAVNLALKTYNLDVPEGHIKFFIKPKASSTPKIEIVKNIEGKYNFDYPSVNIPEMVDPEIIMESVGPAYTTKVSAADILAIQKHILMLNIFTDDHVRLAADVNSDGKISAIDLVNITKVILGLIPSFPNDTPSYKSIPSKISLTPNVGNTVALDFTIVKIGNVN